MAKSKEELKAVLMAQEAYMPDGETPNTTKLNIISGAVIPPLIEAMWCDPRNATPQVSRFAAESAPPYCRYLHRPLYIEN